MRGARSFAAALAAAALAAATAGCKADPPTAEREPPPAVTAAGAVRKPGVEVIAAPEAGDVAEIVQGELARAGKEGRRLLVYVGATWCEPCQRFHQAAQKGELDAAFPGLRLVEFDLDRDRDRLQRAGYTSKMIPLFALPRLDGAASGEQIEGSIKGSGAVDQIAPRLQALLDK
jgi:thiol-disulfide isomerase/thioredoxin